MGTGRWPLPDRNGTAGGSCSSQCQWRCFDIGVEIRPCNFPGAFRGTTDSRARGARGALLLITVEECYVASPPRRPRRKTETRPTARQDGGAGGSVGGGRETPPQQLAKTKFRTGSSAFTDGAFRSAVVACAVALVAVVGLIVFELVTQSRLSLHKFGLSFLRTTIWDPVVDQFGALPFIYGTLV